ncbi:MAG: Sec-independent protein translocase subunit TatA/TatB [Solirubrobacteraceae bacterium]
MGGLTNPLHLAFIAIIALIFLGPKRLPELAKSLGSGMREFRETLSMDRSPEVDPMLTVATDAPPAPAPVPEVAPATAPAVPATVTPPHAPEAS